MKRVIYSATSTHKYLIPSGTIGGSWKVLKLLDAYIRDMILSRYTTLRFGYRNSDKLHFNLYDVGDIHGIEETLYFQDVHDDTEYDLKIFCEFTYTTKGDDVENMEFAFDEFTSFQVNTPYSVITSTEGSLGNDIALFPWNLNELFDSLNQLHTDHADRLSLYAIEVSFRSTLLGYLLSAKSKFYKDLESIPILKDMKIIVKQDGVSRRILNMYPMNNVYCISIVDSLDVTSNGYTLAYTTDKLSEAEKVVNLITNHDFSNIEDYQAIRVCYGVRNSTTTDYDEEQWYIAKDFDINEFKFKIVEV